MPYLPEEEAGGVSALPAAVSKVFNIPTGGPTPVQPRQRSGLENVAGFLGDFLTSRLRMGTPYRDARQAEKINAARLMDEQTGDGKYANVGNINPAFAATLSQRDETNKRLLAAQQATEQLREQQVLEAQERRKKNAIGITANRMNFLLQNAKTDEEAEKIYMTSRPLLKQSKSLEEFSDDLDELFPEKWDAATVYSSIASTVPVTGQWSAKRAEEAAAVRAADTKADNARGDRNLDNTISNTEADNARDEQKRRDAIDKANKDRASREKIAAARAAAAKNKSPKETKPKPSGQDIAYLRAHPEVRDNFDGQFGVGMSKRILGQ